jgi:YVTN family beta-propeller protein
MHARFLRYGAPGFGFMAWFGLSTSGSAAPPAIDKQNVGRQADGSVVVSTNQVLRPAGRQLEFLGRPLAVVLHPSGKTAAVLDGSYKALLVVDPESGLVRQELDVPGNSPSFAGLIYSRDGRTLYASLANGVVQVTSVADDGTLTLDGQISGFPKSTTVFPGREDGDPYPGGLALSEDGAKLYVALNRNNSLGVVDIATRTFLKEIPVGNAPHDVVVAGDRAYVSNQGGRPAKEGDHTLNSSGTAIVANGRGAYASTGTVSVIDLASESEVKAIEVGLQPTALLVKGRRLFVANTGSDTISIIGLGSDSVMQTLAVTPFPQAPLGSSPNALAFIDDDHLVVSLGRNNALALYRVPFRPFHTATFEGLLPTGWYPSSIAVDAVRRELIVANGKGVGSLGPEAKIGPDPATNKTGRWVHANRGSVSFIPFPGGRELALETRTVFENNGWNRSGHQGEGEGRARPLPLPERTGEPSVFKHVVYIVKENRTYDQVFGDLPQGNGDPTLVQFGADVTPNHRALAEGFVLLDNIYDSGSLSADGHQWATQAFANDYIEKSFGSFTRSYPFNDGDVLAHARTGFLWDNALRQRHSVRIYGEFVNGLAADSIEMGPWGGTFLGHGVTEAGTWADFYRDAQRLAVHDDDNLHVGLVAHSDIPSLERNLCRAYPPYHQIIPDQYRVEVFLREFEDFVKRGEMPELTIMALTSDHTNGTAATYPTPRAMVADNDLALGRVVEAISHSPFWKDTVIFVNEDDAQNGVDHVDGHRMPALVVSPYTKRGSVDSHYYSQIDFMRAMEQILGLYPMNQMDLAVSPTSMRSVFTDNPDFAPYDVRPNLIALDEMNPAPTALRGVAQKWAIASAKLDFSAPDRADGDLLNRAIWYATKGFDKAYPGDTRVLSPDEVHSHVNSALLSRGQAGGPLRPM